MKIEIKRVDLSAISSEDRQSINEVLAKSSNATVFHSIEWNEVLIDEFGLQGTALLAIKGKQPVGLFIYYVDGAMCRSPMTSLESPYGGPISVGDDSTTVELLKEAERLHRMAVFQVWTSPNYSPLPLVNMGYSSEKSYTSMLNLQKSEEHLWAGLKGSTRGRIRKAQKSEVSVVQGDMSMVDRYYEMVVSTFTRVQVRILPRSYYSHVVEHLGSKGMARLLLAKHKDEFIAGVISLFYKDTAYFWHGASYRQCSDVAPNDLIFWELIKWTRNAGYKYLDFVRVEPDRLPGLARFKMKFGGNIVPCYYLTKKTFGYRLFRIMKYATNPKEACDRLRKAIGGSSRSKDF